jgi:hypothetical protein
MGQEILKRDTKRQAIRDTAYRLFRTQGFDKTSVAEIIEPLLLHARDGTPDEVEIMRAANRAIAVFLRAYAPVMP